MLSKATTKGAACYAIRRSQSMPGHKAWYQLLVLFSQEDTTQAEIDTKLDKRENLYLDESTMSSQHISDFATIGLKRNEMTHMIPTETLRNELLNNTKDPH